MNVVCEKRREAEERVRVETLDLKYQGRIHVAGYSLVGKVTMKCVVHKVVVIILLLPRYLMTLI